MAGTASLALFQKNLQDVVKGIRNHHKRGDPDSFISEAFAEIKIELKSTDVFIKAEAVRKLTYLQSIGYNVSWASFAIIEVMSQPRFDHKKIGYLAANQSFNESTDLILLTTNLFKKEFVNHLNSFYCIGLALNCLGNIATKDLSRDCISDVLQLMNHPRPYIRKKAIITMYKIYTKYPQGFRITFDQLKAKLDDEDGSVVSCAVNVICELAHKNPRNYLAMAPKFFKLLTTSSNNWMLIKVVKLLGSLVSVEPRLARKLLEPLATIVQNTSAKSLQFECIHTVTLALPYTKREDGTDAKNVPAVLNLCLHHLKVLAQDEDPNLKYLGLVGLLSLLKSHPRVVLEQRLLVLNCLDDMDATIRAKALELLVGIVTKKTLVDLVQQLLRHLQVAEGAYRDDIISKILQMGSRARYALVTDFLWYVSVLQRLACVKSSGCEVAVPGDSSSAGGSGDGESTNVLQLPSGGTSYGYDSTTRYSRHGREVSEQLMEIALRVENSRAFVVECMVSLLMNSHLLLQGSARDTVSEVFMAASWVVGEYSSILLDIMLDRKREGGSDSEDEEGSDSDGSSASGEDGYWIEGPDGTELRSRWRKLPLHLLLVETLLHPRVSSLPPRVQGSFVHAALKLFVAALTPEFPHHYLAQIVTYLRLRLPAFLQSIHLEVQERAATFQQLLVQFEVLAPTEEGGGMFRDAKCKTPDARGGECSDDEEHEEEEEDAVAAQADINQIVDDLLIFLPEESISLQNVTSSCSGVASKTDRAPPGIAAAQLAQHAHHSGVLGAHPSAADRRGAAQALTHQGALRVLSAESFYTVHPKAQRKVPVPAGVQLNKAFNAASLREVLALVEPADPSMSTLSFLGASRASSTKSNSFETTSSSKPAASSFTNQWRATDGEDGSTGDMFHTRSREENKDHFYIKSNPENSNGANDDDEDRSSSQGRRAEYEDILVGAVSTEVRKKDVKGRHSSNKKHSGKSKDKEKGKGKGKGDKARGGAHHRVNRVDLTPDGEGTSDEEVLSEKQKKDKRRTRVDSNDSDAGLEDIDITRPLRASDVLPVHKHRETPAHMPTSGAEGHGSGAQDMSTSVREKKPKKSSKEKDKKEHKAKHKSKAGVSAGSETSMTAQDNDLLGLTWNQQSARPEAPRSKSGKSSDRRSSSKHKSAVSQVWIPLYEDEGGAFDVSYSLDYEGAESGRVDLSYRVENRSAPLLSLSLTWLQVPEPLLTAQTQALLAMPGSSPAAALPALQLVSGLPAGQERVVSAGPGHALSLPLSMPGALQALMQLAQGQRGGMAGSLHCSVQLVQSLLEASSPSSVRNVVLVPSICSFCAPLAMSPEEFNALLTSGACSSSGRAKTRLKFNADTYSNPKRVCKVLSKYLQCKQVEAAGEGHALSLCGRLGPRGELAVTVCVLLKVRTASSEVSVEVKCFGSRQGSQVCQQVADGIVAAVDLMDLR